MDYCPNYISDGMQEHAAAQSSAIMSLPFMAMEENVQSCDYIPQAIASPYMGPFIFNEENNYTTMQGENLPKTENLETLNPMNAEPNNIACTYSSFPPWAAPAEPSILSPCSFPFEQGQYLLNLQALLKAQYGICLTLEQLLSFDALPALLHADNEPHIAPHAIGVKLEDHYEHEFSDLQASLGLFNYDNMRADQALHVSQGPNVCVSPLQNKVLCVSESSYRPQDVSSPGSAASSSVVTDSDNSDKLLSAECIAAPIPNIPSPLASVNSQSWINPNISWLSDADGRGVLKALHEMQALGIVEPPTQRRKLQGITLEQVLQAEKMQQINANPPIQAASNPFLGRDVLASMENGVRGGSFDVNGVGEGEHEASRPIPQPRKAATTSIEPQSVAARHRRKRIRERTESLGVIIPGATRLDTAAMFDLAIKYVHFLQAQMFCLENEVSLSQQRLSYEDESVAGFRRALIHRLLSSQDVQHFLSREGLCLVTDSLAKRLNFDPSSVIAMKGPSPPHPPPLGRTI